MTLITIQAGDIAEYRGEAEPAFARLYANQQFTTSEGIVVAQGSVKKPAFYQEFVASRNGDFIHLASGDAYATTNSNKPMSTCTLVVYDENGRVLVTPYHRLRIAHEVSPTTWTALEIFSGAVPMRYPPHYLTAEAILALFDELDGVTEWGQIGGDIQDQTDLIALIGSGGGGGDEHLEGESSLADALAAIGSAQADLYVKEDISVSANTVIPANVRLVIEDGAVITANSGVTLTINSFRDPGNVKCFAGAGAVRFAKGSVDAYKTAWRAGAAGGDITAALNEGIANVSLWNGGDVKVGQGSWTTDGNHVPVSGMAIIGNGGRVLDGNGYGTYIQPTSSVPMFKGNPGTLFMAFKGLHLNGNNIADSAFFYAEGSGIATAPIQGITFEDCTIRGFEHSVRFNSLTAGWMVSSVEFKNCFLAAANTAIFRCNSTNMDTIKFNDCLITPTYRGIWAERVYNIGFNNCSFGGILANVKGNSQMEGSTVVAAAGITASGVGSCTVTWPGILASPVTVSVPLPNTLTTAAAIATAFANALELNEELTEEFIIGTDGVNQILVTAIDPAANVAGANFTIEKGTATGITDDLTSSTVVAGAAPLVGDYPAVEIGDGSNSATFVNCVEEGFGTFVKATSSMASFIGCTILDPVRGSSPYTTAFATTGCKLGPKVFDSEYSGIGVLTSLGDSPTYFSFVTGGVLVTLAGTKVQRRGNPLIRSLPFNSRIKFGGGIHAHESTSMQQGSAVPLIKLTSTDSAKTLLQLGYQASEENADPQGVYNIARDASDGHLRVFHSPALAGTIYDGVKFDGAVKSARYHATREQLLGFSGPLAIDTSYANRFTLTPTGDVSLYIGTFQPGTFFQIAITTIGTTPHTISFQTGVGGFDTIQPFSTGTVAGERHLFTFYVVDSGRAELVSDPRGGTGQGVYNPTHLTADNTYAGDVISGFNNLGGVTQWDAVYLNGASQWVKADANLAGAFPALGLAIATVATATATTVIKKGLVRNDAWAWTPGLPIYLSTTTGGLTQTAPSASGECVQIMGIAMTADQMFVDPQLTWIELT